MRANVQRVDRYSCLQTVDRTGYEPVQGRWKNASCEEIWASRASGRDLKRAEAAHDRIRLSLVMTGSGETHTWPRGAAIEQNVMDSMTVGGTWGTGDFNSFTSGVFLTPQTSVKPVGVSEAAGRRAVEFEYEVPLSASRYRVKTRQGNLPVSYHGRFWLAADNADLLRLTVRVDRMPGEGDACSAATSIDLAPVMIRGTASLLPSLTTLETEGTGGTMFVNRIRYEACREFSAESSMRFDFDDGPVAAERQHREVRPREVVELALTQPIDTRTAAAGDEVTATSLHQVTLVDGKLPPKSVWHGRIIRVSYSTTPEHGMWIGLKFDEIEIDGRRVPVRLRPAAQVLRSPQIRMIGITPVAVPGVPEAGGFWFEAPMLARMGRGGMRTTNGEEWVSSDAVVLRRGWLMRWQTW